MTGAREKLEPMWARLARVAGETAPAGGVARVAARLLLNAARVLDKSGCAVLCALPPHLLTRPVDRRRLARNRELQGRHRGKRCFILGNGPSLGDEDLSLLRGEICFTVNQGHRVAAKNALKPTYHACVDALHLQPEFDDLYAEWALFQQTTGAVLLLSGDIADRMAALGRKVDYYAVKQYLISTYFDRSGRFVPIDLHYVQPGYVSVVHFAIVAALYMEFSEIYLLGCDMDFFLQPDAPLRHSYDDEHGAGGVATASDLFGGDQVELMEWALIEYRAYRQLGGLANARGCRVINAGSRSALSVFPREPLRSVLGRRTGVGA